MVYGTITITWNDDQRPPLLANELSASQPISNTNFSTNDVFFLKKVYGWVYKHTWPLRTRRDFSIEIYISIETHIVV